MNIAFFTLGCKVNSYESQELAELMTAAGHTIVKYGCEADAYIVNS